MGAEGRQGRRPAVRAAAGIVHQAQLGVHGRLLAHVDAAARLVPRRPQRRPAGLAAQTEARARCRDEQALAHAVVARAHRSHQGAVARGLLLRGAAARAAAAAVALRAPPRRHVERRDRAVRDRLPVGPPQARQRPGQRAAARPLLVGARARLRVGRRLPDRPAAAPAPRVHRRPGHPRQGRAHHRPPLAQAPPLDGAGGGAAARRPLLLRLPVVPAAAAQPAAAHGQGADGAARPAAGLHVHGRGARHDLAVHGAAHLPAALHLLRDRALLGVPLDARRRARHAAQVGLVRARGRHALPQRRRHPVVVQALPARALLGHLEPDRPRPRHQADHGGRAPLHAHRVVPRHLRLRVHDRHGRHAHLQLRRGRDAVQQDAQLGLPLHGLPEAAVRAQGARLQLLRVHVGAHQGRRDPGGRDRPQQRALDRRHVAHLPRRRQERARLREPRRRVRLVDRAGALVPGLPAGRVAAAQGDHRPRDVLHPQGRGRGHRRREPHVRHQDAHRRRVRGRGRALRGPGQARRLGARADVVRDDGALEGRLPHGARGLPRHREGPARRLEEAAPGHAGRAKGARPAHVARECPAALERGQLRRHGRAAHVARDGRAGRPLERARRAAHVHRRRPRAAQLDPRCRHVCDGAAQVDRRRRAPPMDVGSERCASQPAAVGWARRRSRSGAAVRLARVVRSQLDGGCDVRLCAAAPAAHLERVVARRAAGGGRRWQPRSPRLVLTQQPLERLARERRGRLVDGRRRGAAAERPVGRRQLLHVAAALDARDGLLLGGLRLT